MYYTLTRMQSCQFLFCNPTCRERAHASGKLGGEGSVAGTTTRFQNALLDQEPPLGAVCYWCNQPLAAGPKEKELFLYRVRPRYRLPGDEEWTKLLSGSYLVAAYSYQEAVKCGTTEAMLASLLDSDRFGRVRFKISKYRFPGGRPGVLPYFDSSGDVLYDLRAGETGKPVLVLNEKGACDEIEEAAAS